MIGQYTTAIQNLGYRDVWLIVQGINYSKNKGKFYHIKRCIQIFSLNIMLNIKGFKGIRKWLINYCTSPEMTHKITTSADYNLWLKRLDTQPNELSNNSPQSC